MALTGNPFIGESDASTYGAGGGRLRVNVAAGAASGALVGVNPEMVAGDLVISAMEVPANGAMVDRTGVVISVEASGVMFSEDTSGNQVLVFWLDRAP